MISKLEAMAEQRGLLASLRRSHAGLIAVVTTVLTCGSLTNALANGKHHGHTSHLSSWHAERDFGHGWGWDPTSVGYYEGPTGVFAHVSRS
jgi:hypothetical protein